MIGNHKNDFSFMTVNCSNLLLYCLLTPAKGVNYWGADQSAEMYCVY